MKKSYARILSLCLIMTTIFGMAIAVSATDVFDDEFSKDKKNILENFPVENIRGSGQKNAVEGYAALVDYTLRPEDGQLESHYVGGPGGSNEDPPGDQFDPAVGNRNWVGFDFGSVVTFDSYQMIGTTLSRWDSDIMLNLNSWIVEVSDDDSTWKQIDEVIDIVGDEIVNRTLSDPVTARYIRFIIVEANSVFTGRIRIGGIKIFAADEPEIEIVVETPAPAVVEPVIEPESAELVPEPTNVIIAPKTSDPITLIALGLLISATSAVISKKRR